MKIICDICGKECNGKNGLNSHRRWHNPEFREMVREKISKGMLGHKLSESTKKKISEKNKANNSGFKKGYTPWNKKGNPQKRTFIRISNGIKLKSRQIWEEYHKRKIPNNFVIHHIDENSKNDDIKNLRLMRKEDHNFLHQMIDKVRYNKKKQVEKLKKHFTDQYGMIDGFDLDFDIREEIDKIFGRFE